MWSSRASRSTTSLSEALFSDEVGARRPRGGGCRGRCRGGCWGRRRGGALLAREPRARAVERPGWGQGPPGAVLRQNNERPEGKRGPKGSHQQSANLHFIRLAPSAGISHECLTVIFR